MHEERVEGGGVVWVKAWREARMARWKRSKDRNEVKKWEGLERGGSFPPRRFSFSPWLPTSQLFRGPPRRLFALYCAIS